MIELIAQTTQRSGHGMTTWSPMEWGVFFGVLAVGLGQILTVIKQFMDSRRITDNAGKIQTVAKATATIAEPSNPNATLPDSQMQAVKKIGTGSGEEVPAPAPEPEKQV
jgi:hypothetical protein